jgi:hypothetical protein
LKILVLGIFTIGFTQSIRHKRLAGCSRGLDISSEREDKECAEQSHTIFRFASVKGAFTAERMSSFHFLALRLNAAPGTHSGTYFNIGNAS